MKEIYMSLSKSYENLSKAYYNLALSEGIELKVQQENITQQIYMSNNETLSIEKIREVLADKLKSGKKNEIKELLKKYKSSKLSDVKEEDYRLLFLDANKL